MKALFPSQCPVCHNPIQRGMEIEDSGMRGPRGGKKMAHVECLGGARRNPRRTRRNTSGPPKGYTPVAFYGGAFGDSNEDRFLSSEKAVAYKIIGRVSGKNHRLPRGYHPGTSLVAVSYDGNHYTVYLLDEEDVRGKKLWSSSLVMHGVLDDAQARDLAERLAREAVEELSGKKPPGLIRKKKKKAIPPARAFFNPRVNAGRRTFRGEPKEGRPSRFADYEADENYLFGLGSKELARMGTPEALEELERRERGPDGVKLAWKR